MALHVETTSYDDPERIAKREAAAADQYLAALVREREMVSRSPRLSAQQRASALTALNAEIERAGGEPMKADAPARQTRESKQAETRAKRGPGRPRKKAD